MQSMHIGHVRCACYSLAVILLIVNSTRYTLTSLVDRLVRHVPRPAVDTPPLRRPDCQDPLGDLNPDVRNHGGEHAPPAHTVKHAKRAYRTRPLCVSFHPHNVAVRRPLSLS